MTKDTDELTETREREDGRQAGGASLLVSECRVTLGPIHDRVRIWNRGAIAGELVVVAGDGHPLRDRLASVGVAARELRRIGTDVAANAERLGVASEAGDLSWSELLRVVDDVATSLGDIAAFAERTARTLDGGPR